MIENAPADHPVGNTWQSMKIGFSRDVQDIFTNLSKQISEATPVFDYQERPGLTYVSTGLTAKHPIVMVPGVVTTGLEVWKGRPCIQRYFRQRIWGTINMAKHLLLDQVS